jgi:hypothetical protein
MCWHLFARGKEVKVPENSRLQRLLIA